MIIMRENREVDEASLPFTSTGPAGHRSRMRQKLLTRGPAALADYELLEMILFLGIDRRDTKPLAKAAINQFGGLAETLAAALLAHLGRECVVALKLAQEAAARLARAEIRDRAHLANWEGVQLYLDGVVACGAPLRTLYLNNRNRLLGDEPVPDSGVRAIAARALDLHATAVILVSDGTAPSPELRATIRRLLEASDLLTLKLHDCVLGRPGAWRSLRAAGQLK